MPISALKLRAALQAVKVAASRDTTRRHLNGVRLHCVTLSGHTVGQMDVKIVGINSVKAAIKALRVAPSKDFEVAIEEAVGGRELLIIGGPVGDTVARLPTLDESFPPYRKVIPAAHTWCALEKGCRLNPAYLADAGWASSQLNSGCDLYGSGTSVDPAVVHSLDPEAEFTAVIMPMRK